MKFIFKKFLVEISTGFMLALVDHLEISSFVYTRHQYPYAFHIQLRSET
jgi:hypothetical protein